MVRPLLLLLAVLGSVVFATSVVCTLNPYFLIVQELAGDRLQVHLLIKPGFNPHTFSPTVSDVKMLSDAGLIIANGLGLDNPFLKGFSNVAYVGEKVPPSELLEDDVHEDKVHGKVNPHVWLHPRFLANYIVPAIRDELSRFDPRNASVYKGRASVLITKLRSIDLRFSNLLRKFKGGVAIIEHPSYFYLFETNGVELLALEEGHGKQPSAERIKTIVEKARTRRLVGIFVGPQFNKSAIEVVARELSRNYHTLDPLGFRVKSIVELFENAYKSIEAAASEAGVK